MSLDAGRLPVSVDPASRSFLRRLVEQVANDERVRVVFLGGSHSRGAADAWSDLDLYLLTTDEGHESFTAGRLQLMASLGDVVFLEEHSDFGFRMLLYMYADGVHGELALAPESQLAEVHAGPYAVLLDKGGRLDGEPLPEGRLEPASARGVVRRLLVWFWYDRRLLDVALRRGKLWTAHFYLERCRERCLDLLRMVARPDCWPGGYEKAEEVLEDSLTAPLAATVVPLDCEAMAAAARAVTAVYVQCGPLAARLVGADYPARLADHVRSLLRD